jgi:excisionase family DNA binding protein
MQLSINEVADMFGVHPDTIRDWDKQGILLSTRTAGGHRRYDREEVLKVFKLNNPSKPRASLAERAILINQKLIQINQLNKKVNADEIKQLNLDIKAYQMGYEAAYEDFDHINKDVLLVSECNEVSSILEMYWQLQRAAEKNQLSSDLFAKLIFPGFDNHSESSYWGYSYFLVVECKLFENFKTQYPDLSSVGPNLHKFRKMLNVFNAIKKQKFITEELNKQYICKILEVE